MSISSIDSHPPIATVLSSSSNGGVSVNASSSTSNASVPSPLRRGGGLQFMQEVQMALMQSGINLSMPALAASTVDQVGHDNSSEVVAASARAISQDLHKLMHDLFAAVKQTQSQASSGKESDGSSALGGKMAGYASLSSGLQSLIQQLSSGASSSSDSNSPLSVLQADFAALLKDSQNASTSSSSTNRQTATLQSFLQNLLNNLNGQSSSSPALGGLVSTVS